MQNLSEEPRKITKPSLIESFIDYALSEHEEPQRAGTQPGEAIGFSRTKKTAAILLALSGKTERALANELCISESLLRKWLCEDAFRALARKHAYDFPRFFAEQMSALAKELESNGARDEEAPRLEEEVIGPSAEVAISSEVEKALSKKIESVKGDKPAEGEELTALTWLQAAFRHATALEAAKQRNGKQGKWILHRHPNDELMGLWKFDNKARSGEGPLEAALWMLRQRLYREAERMLLKERLEEGERQRIRSVISELRESDEVLTAKKEAP
jgi:hypothetical protein